MIIGCGRLGSELASQMSDDGREVTVIDENTDAFRKLSPSYGGLTVAGDASVLSVLKDAGLDNADTVIAVTDDDNTNIMAAQAASVLYHVPNIICRVYDSERACIYEDSGIRTICPTALSIHEVDQVLEHEPCQPESEQFCMSREAAI